MAAPFCINHSALILQNDKIILTELRTWGIRQNVIYASLTAFTKGISELYLKGCEWRLNGSGIKVLVLF